MAYRFSARSTTPGDYRLVASNVVLLPIMQADAAAAVNVRKDTARWTGAAGVGNVGTLDVAADNPPIYTNSMGIGL